MKIEVPFCGTYLVRYAEVLINYEKWRAVDPQIFSGIELQLSGRFWHIERIDGKECWLYINGRGVELPTKNAYRLRITECGG